MISPRGTAMNLQYYNILVTLSQLNSSAAKRLSSIQGFRVGVSALVTAVTELSEQLDTIRRSLQPIISLGDSLSVNRLPPGWSMQQAVYLQYVYFNTILDIHTALTCPWSRTLLGMTPDPTLRIQVEKSNLVVVETCRKAILATESINMHAGTPVP